MNYIDLDTQEACDICKKTILGQRTVDDDLSLNMELDDEELQSPFITKIIDRNEQYEEEMHDDDEDTDADNATWRGFVDIDDDMETSDFEIDEEFDDDEPEEIEETEVEVDDFEYVSADDYCADDDEDDEENEDDF
ncbi:MAG: hypothetical protein IJ514_01960 [Clostridia bacterium]|nr:hypothetical protein [Clostridia bacterium]